MRAFITAIGVVFSLSTLYFCSGCVSTPDSGQQLSESGKVALGATARIAVRHYVQDHPGRAGEIVVNIRDVASLLSSVTEDTTVSGLRVVVEAELATRVTDPLDRQDAHDLLDVFEALLREQIGKDEIDSASLVQVNEFASMILAALPATSSAP